MLLLESLLGVVHGKQIWTTLPYHNVMEQKRILASHKQELSQQRGIACPHRQICGQRQRSNVGNWRLFHLKSQFLRWDVSSWRMVSYP